LAFLSPVGTRQLTRSDRQQLERSATVRGTVRIDGTGVDDEDPRILVVCATGAMGCDLRPQALG
jgi:hypothetical protein